MRIDRIFSNKETFRPVELKPGFNVLLADRTKTSTRTDSRNGLGKTTLLEIVNFLLGSNLTQEQNLYSLRGSDWEFSADMRVRGARCTVTRSLDTTAEIHVAGTLPGLGVDLDKSGGVVRVGTWKSYLGDAMFSLSSDVGDGEAYAPSYRALASFFMRLGRGAYLSPFESRPKQLKWQTQVYNAYLLDLNWRAASELQKVRDTEKTLNAIGKQSAATLDSVVGRVGELESERVRLRRHLDDLTVQANDFRVVPEYRQVETRVNRITFRMQELGSRNAFDSRLVLRYRDQLTVESAPDDVDVVTLFEEVGVIFPEDARRTLDEVNDFHRAITTNRLAYLQGEILRLENDIAARRTEVDRLEAERQEALTLLSTGGALEDFTKIQMRIASTAAEVEDVERRIADARRLRAGKAEIAVEKQQIQRQAEIDHEERRPRWTVAIEQFASNTEFLYGDAGDLIIDVQETGYEFRARIEKGGSQGRTSMSIFCYDLALSRLWAAKAVSPGFLIHDSELFADVDERQKARALLLSARQCEEAETQYLALLNSDTLPTSELSALDFNLEKYVCHRLTDLDDSGSLLGVRF